MAQRVGKMRNFSRMCTFRQYKDKNKVLVSGHRCPLRKKRVLLVDFFVLYCLPVAEYAKSLNVSVCVFFCGRKRPVIEFFFSNRLSGSRLSNTTGT